MAAKLLQVTPTTIANWESGRSTPPPGYSKALRYSEHDLTAFAEQLFNRRHNKVLKLALLWALSEKPYNPQISADGVIWATKFVTHLTRKMLYQTQFYVAEGKFDRLKKRCVALIAAAGGSLDRTTLLHKLGIDAVTFKKLILTLEMCNLIECEFGERGKHIYHFNAA